jgi:hypothetical protein
MAEARPSASKKKSKAPSKPKAPAVEEATLERVLQTSVPAQAPAAEQDTLSAGTTQQSPQVDPAAEASKGKAPSPAKKSRVKASSVGSPKSRTGKAKQTVADDPAPSPQAVSEGSGELPQEQNMQAAARKLELFGDAGAKPEESGNGSAAQSAQIPSAPQEPASDVASAKTPAKRKSPKRMVRASKPASGAQGIRRNDGG